MYSETELDDDGTTVSHFELQNNIKIKDKKRKMPIHTSRNVAIRS